MGSADDWTPLMQALATTHHCVAVDLPGHDKTRLTGWFLHAVFLVTVPSLFAETEILRAVCPATTQGLLVVKRCLSA